MQKEILAALLVLTVALGGIHGQTCSETFDLTVVPVPISLNASLATSCIRCIDGAGNVATMVQWSTQNIMPLVNGMNGVSSTGNGVLVINDAITFLSMGTPVLLQCTGSGSQLVYRAGLFAPTVIVPNGGEVTEDDSITITCFTTNNRPGTFQVQWYNPAGVPVSIFTSLPLMNVSRNQAGDYTCRLTSTENGEFLEDSGTLTVNYLPDIVSNNSASNMFFVTGTISLSCIYDSVPVSAITWFHDGLPLTNGAGGAIINFANGVSTLMRSQLTSTSGGTYACTATNSVGSASVSVEVIIQVPPAAPTNLIVTNIGETSFDLSWTNGFNGLSPITGVTVTVYHFTSGLMLRAMSLPGDSSLQTTEISGLNPFTEFRITVTVNNAVGSSDPAEITVMTLSLRLGAPRMVTLTSPTSTTLVAEWLPPVPSVLTTSPPEAWFVNLRDSNGMDLGTNTVSDPTTLTYMFTQLDKGSEYRVRVAGNNSRGIGDYSEFVSNETIVDPPTMPRNLTGEGVSAAALSLSWLLPADNGGRAVTEYIIRFRAVGTVPFSEIALTETSLLLFNTSTPLVNSTSYEIEVLAVNTAGRGVAATITITTQSLDEPQPIFIEPVSEQVTNRTAVVSWVFPGGQVNEFIVQYKVAVNDWTTSADVMERRVLGNVTMVMLTDLIPSATYDVRIASVNTMGTSEFRNQGAFSTQPPSPPTVSSPESSFAGQTTQLNCSSSVSNVLPIIWARPGRTLPSSARQVGDNLVFTNPQSTDTGTYSCTLTSTNVGANVTISFLTPPTEAPPVISETLIIVLSVLGGVVVIIFLLVLILACYCTCCTKSSQQSSSYNVKSKAKTGGGRTAAGRIKGKGKRGMTWIETSTKFVPKTHSRKQQANEPSPFDMPDDLTTHSSFNTLEKQNRIRQNADPNEPPPSYGNSNV